MITFDLGVAERKRIIGACQFALWLKLFTSIIVVQCLLEAPYTTVDLQTLMSYQYWLNPNTQSNKQSTWTDFMTLVKNGTYWSRDAGYTFLGIRKNQR
jgi:hypothetical protein